jgi:TPP-dependent pyruvate/acetoin dehydrogenase alpha subunit
VDQARPRFRTRLFEEGTLTEDEDRDWRAETKREVADAVKSAEAVPDPAPEDGRRYVFAPQEPS